jgi:hypothetical protein
MVRKYHIHGLGCPFRGSSDTKRDTVKKPNH